MKIDQRSDVILGFSLSKCFRPNVSAWEGVLKGYDFQFHFQPFQNIRRISVKIKFSAFASIPISEIRQKMAHFIEFRRENLCVLSTLEPSPQPFLPPNVAIITRLIFLPYRQKILTYRCISTNLIMYVLLMQQMEGFLDIPKKDFKMYPSECNLMNDKK